MNNFDGLGLPAALAASLARMQYTTPTPIQAQAIPLALQGRDILGTAQTGTGKTAAFGIPLVARLMSSPRGSALVLCPTRELAAQVMEIMQQLLGQRSFIPAVLVIGGDSMTKQTQLLKMRPRIIVGTPGRINDHLERGNLILHDTSFLVLDETDRMLDMGFGIQIERIVKYLPQARQTLMFSATMPDAIVKMSSRYLKNPERIAVGATNAPIKAIEQEILYVSEGTKYDELLKQLDARKGSIILFVKTKRGADKLMIKLNKQKHLSDAIHGDLHQRKREKVIQAFRDQKFRILVATDIASRGLDIPHIEHVINYDLPQCPEDYIHRIGRTARNGNDGSSVCLISPDDGFKWKEIHKLLYPGQPMPHMPHMPKREHHGHASHPRSGHAHPPRPHGENGGGQRRRRFRPRSRSSQPSA